MHLKETEIPWLLHYNFDSMIDFCLWALTKDGMHVPPFDAHSPGDRSLNSAGMQAQEWLEWLVGVVHFQQQQKQVTSQPSQNLIGIAHPAMSVTFEPSDIWRGNPRVKLRLHELWELYQPLMSSRKKWMRSLAAQLRSAGQQLWHDLQPYHTHIPSLTVYFVAYPKQIALPVPPTSIIMTIADGSMDGEKFRQQVLQIVEKSL
jgi:hypothetical protein